MKKSIQYQGSTIFYSVYGSGESLMLVHGFGEKGEVWDNQVEALKNDYSVIVPELPGCGGSELLPDMSMEGMAALLKEILDLETAKGSKPVLLGHSMGGYITLAFVEKNPDYLRSFGLVHSACFADSEEKKETRNKGISFIRKHGAIAFLESSSPNLFSPDTKNNDPQLVKSFIASLSDQNDEALIQFYEAMMARPDRSDVLKNSSLPVLFILGKHDTAIPIKDGLRQTTFPELSYIHVLEHSGHMGMLEEKEKTNHFLIDFLRST
ncbi:MAG: alpha/beta hydrolase [Chitinophagaceae bacterium]|nr:MAG: alpha/beta hydrolase [Chitinophagaceae bacterium]